MKDPIDPTEKRKAADTEKEIEEGIARLETLKRTNEKLRVPSAIQERIEADIARLKQQKQAMEDWGEALKEKRVESDLSEPEKAEEKMKRGPETKTEGLDMLNKIEAAVTEVQESGEQLKEQAQTLSPPEQEQVAAAVKLADAQAQELGKETKEEISHYTLEHETPETITENYLTETPLDVDTESQWRIISEEPEAERPPQAPTPSPAETAELSAEAEPVPATPETAFEALQRLKNEARFGKENAEKLKTENVLKENKEGGYNEQITQAVQTLLGREGLNFWLGLSEKGKKTEQKTIKELETALKDYLGKEGQELTSACCDIFYAFKANITERASQEKIKGVAARIAEPKTIKGKLLKSAGYFAAGFAGTFFLGVGGVIATGALRQLDTTYSQRLNRKKLEQFKQNAKGNAELQEALKNDFAELIVSKKRTDLLGELGGWKEGEQEEWAANRYKQAMTEYLNAHQPQWLQKLEGEQKEKAINQTAEAMAVFYAMDDKAEKINQELQETKGGKWEALAKVVNKIPIRGISDPGPWNKFYTGSAAAGIGTALCFASRGSKTVRRISMAFSGYKLGGAIGEMAAGRKTPEAIAAQALKELNDISPDSLQNKIILDNYSKRLMEAKAALTEAPVTAKNRTKIEQLKKEITKHEFLLVNEEIIKNNNDTSDEIEKRYGIAEKIAKKEVKGKTAKAQRYKIYGRIGGAVLGFLAADLSRALLKEIAERRAAKAAAPQKPQLLQEAELPQKPQKPELPKKEELQFIKDEEARLKRMLGELGKERPLPSPEKTIGEGVEMPAAKKIVMPEIPTREVGVPPPQMPEPEEPPRLEVETKISEDIELSKATGKRPGGPEDIVKARGADIAKPEITPSSVPEATPLEIPPMPEARPEIPQEDLLSVTALGTKRGYTFYSVKYHGQEIEFKLPSETKLSEIATPAPGNEYMEIQYGKGKTIYGKPFINENGKLEILDAVGKPHSLTTRFYTQVRDPFRKFQSHSPEEIQEILEGGEEARAALDDLQRVKAGRWLELYLKPKAEMTIAERSELDYLSAELPKKVTEQIIQDLDQGLPAPEPTRGLAPEVAAEPTTEPIPPAEKDDLFKIATGEVKGNWQHYKVSDAFGKVSAEIKLPQDVNFSEIETRWPGKIGFVALEHDGKKFIGTPKIDGGELKICDANGKEFDIQRVVKQLQMKDKPLFGKFHSYATEQLEKLQRPAAVSPAPIEDIEVKPYTAEPTPPPIEPEAPTSLPVETPAEAPVPKVMSEVPVEAETKIPEEEIAAAPVAETIEATRETSKIATDVKNFVEQSLQTTEGTQKLQNLIKDLEPTNKALSRIGIDEARFKEIENLSPKQLNAEMTKLSQEGRNLYRKKVLITEVIHYLQKRGKS